MGKEGLIEKLKKLFGLIKVKEIDFSLNTRAHKLPVYLSSKSKELSFLIDGGEKREVELSDFKLRIRNESKEEIKARIKDESLTEKNLNIMKESLFQENYNTYSISKLLITTNIIHQEIKDLKAMHSKAQVKKVKVWRRDTIRIGNLKLISRYLNIFNGIDLILKLRIRRRRNLFYYSKDEQLNIWKKIVNHTRKRPKDLELLGLFSNFPISLAKEIKINFKTGDIYFSIAKKNSKIVKETIIIIRNKENGKIEIIK